MELQKWKIFEHLDTAFAAEVKCAHLVGFSSFDDSDVGDSDDDEDTERASTSTLSKMDELENSAYGGDVVIMRNDDVHFITRTFEQLPPPVLHGTEDLLPLVPIKIGPLCGQQIRAVNSGFSHVVILTVEGRIYQWGYNYYEEERVKRRFKGFVTGDGIENKRIIQISCGQNHTIALTTEGDVYAWGINRFGQLGTGRTRNETSPTKISGLNGFNANISLVACSGWTSFALDKDGMVWSWGDNDEGALGYVSSGSQRIPLKITRLKNTKMIAAGGTHALALSNEGNLYFWSQQGSDETTVTPKKIGIPNISFIGAIRGSAVSAFQTAKRKVYFWDFACGHVILDPVFTKFTTIAKVFASFDSAVMFEPMILEQKQPITERLKLNLDDKDTGDLRFNVEGKNINAHCAILKLRSDHFRRMFGNNWKESDGKEVEIKEFSYHGFRAFLFYLYTDRIDPVVRTVEDAIELLRFSDYYGEEDLKHRCERLLKTLITEDKVSKAYAVSCQYNANYLRQIALDFIIPRLNNVVKTDEYRKMPDDMKIRLIQELADENVLVGLKRRRIN